MSQTWAVARQTISEGLRMKIAMVFFMLLAVCVLGEDIQDDLPAVENLDAKFSFEISLLVRPEKILEDDQVHVVLLDGFPEARNRS